MSEHQGLINQYICNVCGGEITTVNADDGTTPMMLQCRVTDGCRGTMHSQFYRVDQELMADYEWYKPNKLPKGEMREYVKMGGLMLRKL